jgi:sterol desaturase/sphingolipid hydroxylase (fatty acid hydroxylase superfamily)
MVSTRSLVLFASINATVFTISYAQYAILSTLNYNVVATFLTVCLKAGFLLQVLHRITAHRPRIFPANTPGPSFHWLLFLRTYGIETLSYLIAMTMAQDQGALWKDILLFLPTSFAYELVFDLGHYATHRLLHTVPFLYQHIHKSHHTHTHMNAHTTYCHSPQDLFITNLLPIMLASALIPVTPFTLTAIFWYKTAIEMSGHTGKDTSGSFIQCIYLPEALGISLYSRDHALHHLHPTVNFSKRFSLWDRVFGTKGSVPQS